MVFPKYRLLSCLGVVGFLCFLSLQAGSDMIIVGPEGQAEPLIVIDSDGKRYIQIFGPAPEYEKKPLIPLPPDVDPSSFIRFKIDFPDSQITAYDFYDLPNPPNPEYFKCINGDDYQNCDWYAKGAK